MARVLFVVPPYHAWGVQVIGSWPPLHIAYAAGSAERAGHEARIFDAMNHLLLLEDVRREIEAFAPKFVVTMDYLPVTGAIATATVPAALEVLALAKGLDPDVVTVLGGPHPTFMYEEILNDAGATVDFIIRGEMERTLVELLDAPRAERNAVLGIATRIADSVHITPMRPHIEDLDTLQPAWHLLDWDAYHYNIEPQGRMASVLTSRGCMMGCSFCSQRLFWRGEWRGRDPQSVISEIEHLVREYDVRYVTLIDAYPTRDRERWERLLDLLIDADLGVSILMETRVEDIIRDADILPKYREAGIIHLYLGAESSSDEMLASLNKGTSAEMNKRAIDLARDNDIMTEASFMIGSPGETWESIRAIAEETIRLNPDIAIFPVLTPMPFTPLHGEVRDRIRVFDYAQYNLVTPIIEPYAMSLEEVTEALGYCYMTFYQRKMAEVLALPEGFKRRYMLSAFKQMMRDYGERFDFGGMGHGGMQARG